MSAATKPAGAFDRDVIHQSLEKAAEVLGDITPLVYESLFSRLPDVEHHFRVKGEVFKHDLQSQMVQDAIYAFMEYLETPEEVDIVFKYTIPQHLDLGIPVEYFNALLSAVAEVVCSAVAAEEREPTRSSWNQLTEELSAIAARYGGPATLPSGKR